MLKAGCVAKIFGVYRKTSPEGESGLLTFIRTQAAAAASRLPTLRY
jgi:hypothetical protein